MEDSLFGFAQSRNRLAWSAWLTKWYVESFEVACRTGLST